VISRSGLSDLEVGGPAFGLEGTNKIRRGHSENHYREELGARSKGYKQRPTSSPTTNNSAFGG